MSGLHVTPDVTCLLVVRANIRRGVWIGGRRLHAVSVAVQYSCVCVCVRVSWCCCKKGTLMAK